MRWIAKLMVIIVILLSVGNAFAQEQTGSITVYLPSGEGDITVYAIDALEESDPQRLWELVRDLKLQGRTQTAVLNGPTIFENLPQGRYLVTHEDDLFLPFLVSIPSNINGATSLAVEAHPKTENLQTPQTGDPLTVYPLALALVLSLSGIIMLLKSKKKWK